MKRTARAARIVCFVLATHCSVLADSEAVLRPAREALGQLRDPRSRVDADQARAMVATFDQALDQEPGAADWTIGRAMALRASGDAEGALQALKALVKASPRNAEARYELGQTWMATISSGMGIMAMADRAGSAKDEWEEAVKIDPGHVRARYAAGMYWLQARRQGGWLFGSYDKAQAHAEALLKLPEGRGEFAAQMILGSIAAAKENWDEMSRRFLAAETASGELADPASAMMLHASELVRAKQDGKAALPVLERLIALQPDNRSATYLRGESYRLIGDCQRAVENYELVLASNQDARNSRFQLAECYAKMGRHADAVREYDEFAKRFPKDDLASKAKNASKKLRKLL